MYQEAWDNWLRRRAFFILSIVLAIGFFLPIAFPKDIAGTYTWIQPNLEILRQRELGWSLKALALYPLCASVVVLLVTRVSLPLVRGIVLLGVGVLAFLLPFFDTVPRFDMIGSAAVSMPDGFGLSYKSGLFLLGFLGLFVGSRTLRYAGEWRGGAVVGLLGGACAVALCFIPLPWMNDVSVMPVEIPYKLIKMDLPGTTEVAILLLLWMLFTAIATVLCLLALLRPADDVDGRVHFGRLVFAALVSSYLLPLLSALHLGLSSGADFAQGWLTFVLIVLKLITWALALTIMIPMAVSDIIIDLLLPRYRQDEARR